MVFINLFTSEMSFKAKQKNFFIIYLFIFIEINCLNSFVIKNNFFRNSSKESLCLIEGDIVCPQDYDENDTTFYMASLDRNKLWLTRLIPYLIASTYTPSEKQLIKEAISELEGKTCVKFKELSSEPNDEDFIYIRPIQGCYSSIGRATGKQDLSLTSDCLNKGKGTVIHELIHALGIWHEHTRPDRDSYVFVELGNIIPGLESNFKIRPNNFVDMLGEPYDYYSIMHYGIYDFSIDPNSRPTLRVLDQKIDVKQVGQRTHVSDLDKKKLDKLYECQIQSCEKPVQPSGGSSTGDDFKVGAIVKFECDSGLTLTGSHESFCRYDGRWSGQVVQCLDKPLHYCNFESTGSEMCGWTHTSDTQFDWLRKSGATLQPDSGPIEDFTYETSVGHYILMETSPPRRRGDVAKIQTPELSSPSGMVCVSFAYYMWGQKLGTLGLYLSEPSVGTKLVWELNGVQGPKWTQHKILVKTTVNAAFHLIFEGIVGLRDYSDIALDEVLVIACNEDEALKNGFKDS